MRPGFGLLSITNNGSSRGMATGPLQRSGTSFLQWLRQLEYVHEMSREPGAVQLFVRPRAHEKSRLTPPPTERRQPTQEALFCRREGDSMCLSFVTGPKGSSSTSSELATFR